VSEPDQTRDQDPEERVRSARATLEAFFAAGWPTPGVPLFLAGGYVTKERCVEALLVICDYVDRATGHPDARPQADAGPEDGGC
jgi:hypothetical protein